MGRRQGRATWRGRGGAPSPAEQAAQKPGAAAPASSAERAKSAERPRKETRVEKSRAPARPATPSTPRGLAIQVLARVAATDAFLNVVLDSALDEHPLADPRDAGLVTELCYGTTRRQLSIDFALASLSDHRLETLEDKVLAALRLGAYQLFYLRTPKHAAVGDTVEALKSLGVGRASGFVNAVLRKLSALEALPLPPPADRAAFLAVKESHPEWLVRRWIRQFGDARAEAMLAADNDAPPLVIRTNTAKLDRAALLAQLTEVGVDARATTISPLGLVITNPGRIEDLYGYAEGLWQVQDEAAQLVGVFAQVPATARVLDACAAPGGKTCHLAQTNRVLSLDVHANKLPKIASEAQRLGLSERVTTRCVDVSKPLPDDLGEYDAVIVDAPCSGLGTLRRHPELRYRRSEAGLTALTHIQRAILEHCQHVVAPGGLLIYAVCSTDPTEGADQIELFLRSHPDFTTEPPVGLAQLPTVQGHLRTLPGPEGLDGFFAARLRRMY